MTAVLDRDAKRRSFLLLSFVYFASLFFSSKSTTDRHFCIGPDNALGLANGQWAEVKSASRLQHSLIVILYA